MFRGFANRFEAGKILAARLETLARRANTIVLALPRGGVPVAFEIAERLDAPLDVLIVRKLGVPGQEEFAFGAIASGGVRVLNEEIIRALRLPESVIEKVTRREQAELERRERLYRGARPFPDLRGQTVVVVDDGLATGATMKAAIKALKNKESKEIIVAVPVGSSDTCRRLRSEADVWCVCAVTPEPFYGVGTWYEDFSQTTDAEVIELLSRAENFGGEKRIAA
jgi:putative phosphoribosyl transferase